MLISILPFILGAAISPTLLLVAILVISSSERPLAKIFSFGLGSLLTISVIGSLILFLHYSVNSQTTFSDKIIHIFLGVLLIGLAIRVYIRGKKKLSDDSGITTTNKSKKLFYYFVLGIAMMLVNITTIMMFIPVSSTLTVNHATLFTTIYVLLLMLFTSMLPVTAPLAIIISMGQNSKKVLYHMNLFMKAHGYQITSIFFGILGAYTIIKDLI